VTLYGAEVLRFGLRRQRRGTVLWACSLAAYSAAIAATWPSIRRAHLDKVAASLPATLRKAFGFSNVGSPGGYLSAELFALVVPALLIVAAVLVAANLTAGDEDGGLLEMVLAQPVARAVVLYQRYLVILLELCAITAVALVALLVVDPLVDLKISGARLASACLTAGMLALVHAAVVVAAAGLGASRRLAAGAAAAVAVVGYLAMVIAGIAPPLSWLQGISPWHWLAAGQVIQHGLKPGGIFLGLAIAAVLVAVGLAGFQRRDIRGA
jgi:ABC-2 type transport system permease protein